MGRPRSGSSPSFPPRRGGEVARIPPLLPTVPGQALQVREEAAHGLAAGPDCRAVRPHLPSERHQLVDRGPAHVSVRPGRNRRGGRCSTGCRSTTADHGLSASTTPATTRRTWSQCSVADSSTGRLQRREPRRPEDQEFDAIVARSEYRHATIVPPRRSPGTAVSSSPGRAGGTPAPLAASVPGLQPSGGGGVPEIVERPVRV